MKRGFTVFELLIVLAIGGVFVTIIFFFFARFAGCGAAAAEEEARSWAASMGYKNAHVTCVTRDTDGDGYVSCTVLPEDRGQPLAIECASWNVFGNDGCRMQRAFNGRRP